MSIKLLQDCLLVTYSEQEWHDVIGHSGKDPIKRSDALNATRIVMEDLLADNNTQQTQVLIGDNLVAFLNGIQQMSEDEVRNALQQATSDCQRYNQAYIAKKQKMF